MDAVELPEGLIRDRAIHPFGFGWPNVLSVLRIVLAPVLVVLIVPETLAMGALAAAVFAVGAATDRLDGYLARRYGPITPTGEWLDPLADKLLLAAPLVTLTALGRFPIWAAAVILVREVAITALRIQRGSRGESMPASPVAKWKTAVQQLAILLYLIPGAVGVLDPVPYAVLLLAVALTVWSAIEYVIQFRRITTRPAA